MKFKFKTKYRDLGYGQVYTAIHDKTGKTLVLIKIEEVTDDCGHMYNSIDLANGDLADTGYDETVIPYRAEVNLFPAEIKKP